MVPNYSHHFFMSHGINFGTQVWWLKTCTVLVCGGSNKTLFISMVKHDYFNAIFTNLLSSYISGTFNQTTHSAMNLSLMNMLSIIHASPPALQILLTWTTANLKLKLLDYFVVSISFKGTVTVELDGGEGAWGVPYSWKLSTLMAYLTKPSGRGLHIIHHNARSIKKDTDLFKFYL